MSNNQTQGASIEAEREFEAWWDKEGQYIRAGGGDYEKCFAYGAWNARRTPSAPAGAGELPPPDVIAYTCIGDNDAYSPMKVKQIVAAAIAADRTQLARQEQGMSNAEAAAWARENGLNVPPQWDASAQPDRGAAPDVSVIDYGNPVDKSAPHSQPVRGVPDDEQCDRAAALALDSVAAKMGVYWNEVNTDTNGHSAWRRALVRAGFALAAAPIPAAQPVAPAQGAQVGRQSASPLVCQQCGSDRSKEPCGNPRDCGMTGQAYSGGTATEGADGMGGTRHE